MLREVIERALEITGGEDGWANPLLRLSEVLLDDEETEKKKSRKAFLADKLIKATKYGNISWTVSDEKDMLIGEAESFKFVVCEARSGRDKYGNPAFSYTLTVFDGSKQIIKERDQKGDWRGPYNDSSRRLPVMDLFDVVINGKIRRVPPAHVCGAQGFGMGYGDRCPACESR